MNIKGLFTRKKNDAPQEPVQEPQPLSIEGIPPAPLTPEPDDAEIAAQALLEYLSEKRKVKSEKFLAMQASKGRAATARGKHGKHKDADPTPDPSPTREGSGYRKGKHADDDTSAEANSSLFTLHSSLPEGRTAAYYKHLAWRMQKAREATRLRVTRFLAFVEQELKKPHLPAFGDGSLGLLEAELFKRQDIVERERGELLRRWQHCLALVTVRLMQATHNHNDNENHNENSSTTDDTD